MFLSRVNRAEYPLSASEEAFRHGWKNRSVENVSLSHYPVCLLLSGGSAISGSRNPQLRFRYGCRVSAAPGAYQTNEILSVASRSVSFSLSFHSSSPARRCLFLALKSTIHRPSSLFFILDLSASYFLRSRFFLLPLCRLSRFPLLFFPSHFQYPFLRSPRIQMKFSLNLEI